MTREGGTKFSDIEVEQDGAGGIVFYFHSYFAQLDDSHVIAEVWMKLCPL